MECRYRQIAGEYMKAKPKLLAVVALTFGAIIRLYSQGYLVPNGVSSDFNGSMFVFHIIQTPNNGDYTDFAFFPNGGDTFEFASALDGGVRVFLVSPYDPISLQPIMAQSYTELLSPLAYSFDAGIPFYVGLYTGFGFPVNGVYSNPLFGWAELVNNGGVIQLLGGELEYGGGGIIAGTETIISIPEPTAIGLFALGGLLFAFQRHGVEETT
jgi:hypothetical protein